MRISLFISVFLLSFFTFSQAQEFSFADISQTEKDFNSANLTARMIEGMGFRYYWATEGLRAEDLAFNPVEEGRSSMQTVQHVYILSVFLLGALEEQVFEIPEYTDDSFEQLRDKTLQNFEKSRSILRASKPGDFKNYNITFADGNSLPFWNAINGPISDAIYHTGQIVMMRRMSGNPIAEGVDVLSGIKR